MSYDVSKQVGKKTFHAKKVSSVDEGKSIIKSKINNCKSYLKSNGNHIRKNKADPKFIYVDTSKYNKLVDEWIDYSDYAYTSCGLNSLQREVIIIDCDDVDYGKKTLEEINKTNIVYNYQRTKPNGHSQLGIYIEKIFVRHARSFKRNVLAQNEIFTKEEWEYVQNFADFLKKESVVVSPKINDDTLIDVNRLYLTTVRLLNNNMNGDLGFTGYCCQNPYSSADEGNTVWYNKEHSYKIGELFVLSLKNTVNKIFDFKKRNYSSSTYSGNVTESDFIIEENLDDVDSTLSLLAERFETAYQKSIDGAIFKFVAGVKNFCYRNKKQLTYSYALKSIFQRKDITKDYDYNSIVEHVLNCVDYINEHFDPKKMTFTKEQKELGTKVRKVESLKKWFDIQALLNKGLTHKEIAKELGICTKTIQRLSKLTINDFDIEGLEESLCGITKYKDLYKTLINTVKNIAYNDTEKEILNVADNAETKYENNSIARFLINDYIKELNDSIYVANHLSIKMKKSC